MGKLVLKQKQITATTSRQPISASPILAKEIIINNDDPSGDVFVGDSTVTTGDGLEIENTEKIVLGRDSSRYYFDLSQIYVVSSGTADIRVLYTKHDS